MIRKRGVVRKAQHRYARLQSGVHIVLPGALGMAAALGVGVIVCLQTKSFFLGSASETVRNSCKA